jgi:hypothetical protein
VKKRLLSAILAVVLYAAAGMGSMAGWIRVTQAASRVHHSYWLTPAESIDLAWHVFLPTCWLGAGIVGIAVWIHGAQSRLRSQVTLAVISGVLSSLALCAIADQEHGDIVGVYLMGPMRPGVLVVALASITACSVWSWWVRRQAPQEGASRELR